MVRVRPTVIQRVYVRKRRENVFSRAARILAIFRKIRKASVWPHFIDVIVCFSFRTIQKMFLPLLCPIQIRLEGISLQTFSFEIKTFTIPRSCIGDCFYLTNLSLIEALLLLSQLFIKLTQETGDSPLHFTNH